MADIAIRGVRKSYGRTEVVHGVDLTIRDGEFVVILGPSGCGKSTLLRMIAGLEAISAGEIAIGGRVVNDLEPRERGCAMVFQNYALYPHMTVAENIGYALKVAGVPKAERAERVRAVATTIGLGDYLDRRPGQLSGGQRQRVAMGRAMIREPEVFLFDGSHLALEGGETLALAPALGRAVAGRRVEAGVRPEHVHLVDAAHANGSTVTAAFDFMEELGAGRLYHGRVGGAEFIVHASDGAPPAFGEPIRLAVDPAAVHLFDVDTGRRIDVAPARAEAAE